MCEIIVSGIIIFYFVMLTLVFSRWLAFLQREENLSPKAQLNSVLFLLIAAIFWPLVIPISYLELLQHQQQLHNC